MAAERNSGPSAGVLVVRPVLGCAPNSRRRMRKKLFLGGAMTLAVFGITAGSAIALTPVQTIDGELGGKATPKFDKKKLKKTSVEVTTTTADADNPAGTPPKATKAEVKFDKKDVKFDTKAAKTCDPNAIENTTTDAPLSACGS